MYLERLPQAEQLGQIPGEGAVAAQAGGALIHAIFPHLGVKGNDWANVNLTTNGHGAPMRGDLSTPTTMGWATQLAQQINAQVSALEQQGYKFQIPGQYHIGVGARDPWSVYNGPGPATPGGTGAGSPVAQLAQPGDVSSAVQNYIRWLGQYVTQQPSAHPAAAQGQNPPTPQQQTASMGLTALLASMLGRQQPQPQPIYQPQSAPAPVIVSAPPAPAPVQGGINNTVILAGLGAIALIAMMQTKRG